MKPGEIRVERRTTQPEQPTMEFINDAIRQLAWDVGVRVGDLYNLGARVEPFDLPSRHAPSAESDERVTFLRYKDRDVAFSLELRDEWNMVVTHSVYLGLANDKADRSDHGT